MFRSADGVSVNTKVMIVIKDDFVSRVVCVFGFSMEGNNVFSVKRILDSFKVHGGL